MRSLLRSILCAALLLPAAATAQTIGPDQAQALHQQLNDWLVKLLGPGVKPPKLPLRIEANRDHYNLAWPIRGMDDPAGDVAATAKLRPLDGNRWSIEDIAVPPAGIFTVPIPKAGDTALPAPMKVTFKIGHQDTHGIIDPSMSSASTLHSEIGDVAIITDSPKQHQEEHFDRWLTDSAVEPAQDGRLNVSGDATMEGWQSAVKVADAAPMAVGIKSLHAVGLIDGVSRDRVADLIAATGGLVGAMPDAVTKGDMDIPAPAMAQLHRVVAAFQGIAGAVDLRETMDDVQFQIAGMGGVTVKHLVLGLGGEAPDGKLHAWLDVGLEGLDSATLPPKLAAYLPHHFEIRPSLSGIQTADMEKLALNATGDKKDDKPAAADYMALLMNGDAALGLESLAFDLGPATFNGTGRVAMVSPGVWHGEANLSATGFDDLMKQAQDNPDLAQALPVLIMMRGMAKPDGDRLVWHVVSDGPKLTVNGMDMSLFGGDKGNGQKQRQPVRP